MVPAGSPGCDLRTGPQAAARRACPQSAASLQLAAVRPGSDQVFSESEDFLVRKRATGARRCVM